MALGSHMAEKRHTQPPAMKPIQLSSLRARGHPGSLVRFPSFGSPPFWHPTACQNRTPVANFIVRLVKFLQLSSISLSRPSETYPNPTTVINFTLLALPQTRLTAIWPTYLPKGVTSDQLGHSLATLGEPYGRDSDTLGNYIASTGSTASSHEANIAK